MYLYKVVLEGGRRTVVWSPSAEPAYFRPEVVFGINGAQHFVQRVMQVDPDDDVDGVIYAAPMKPRAAAA
jgi:hypothetical protein